MAKVHYTLPARVTYGEWTPYTRNCTCWMERPLFGAHVLLWGWMFSLCIGIYARSNDLSPFLLFIVGHLDLISVVQSILHVLSSTGMQLSVFPSQSFMHV